MTAYLIRRLLLIPPTLVGMTLVVFFIIRFTPGGPMERHDPELASRILMRGEAAWEVLCDPVTRAMHRRASYPDIDEELLATLLEDRAKALSMRGDRDSAVAMMELRGEFHVPEPRPEAARNRR